MFADMLYLAATSAKSFDLGKVVIKAKIIFDNIST
jgi:hypothetical protein